MKKFIVASMITMFLVCAAVSVNANTVREDCGCGLGAVLIGEKQGLGWNLLGTCLNGTSGNQTFGMTSGTLECGQESAVVNLSKLDKYVSENMDSLAIDIAQGQGESLDALAELANISSDKKDSFCLALQENFQTIYPDANADHSSVVKRISEIIETI